MSKTGYFFGCIVPLIVLFFITALIYGCGYRITYIYHIFEWDARFGMIGEVLAIILGLVGIFFFLTLVFVLLSSICKRYLLSVFVPTNASFLMAFAITPFGSQSLLASLGGFSMWWAITFLLTFLWGRTMKTLRYFATKPPRKSLDSLPSKEDVSRSELKQSKKYRVALEHFVEKCKEYGSLEVFKKSKEYDEAYELFDEEDLEDSTNILLTADLDIAITEYILTKNVSKFQHEVSLSLQADWETQNRTVFPYSTKVFCEIVEDIFYSLAPLHIELVKRQARYLAEAIQQLRTPLPFTDESMYMAIIGAVNGDTALLQQASKTLSKTQSSYLYRLLDDPPRYWFPYITGLATGNAVLCNEGIRMYAEEHHHEVAEAPEDLCYLNLQAVGMANLCRMHGINVAAISLIVPDDLLIDLNVDVKKLGSMFDACFRTT